MSETLLRRFSTANLKSLNDIRLYLLMPTKSAKVCALPQTNFFARMPDAQWYSPQQTELSPQIS